MDCLGQLIKAALEALFQATKYPWGWETTQTEEKRQEEEK